MKKMLGVLLGGAPSGAIDEKLGIVALEKAKSLLK